MAYGALDGNGQKKAPPEPDKLARVQTKVDEIKVLAHQNMEMALDRGETLESMEMKAKLLDTNAKTFRREAKAVRRRMCCQSWKIILCGSTAFLVALTILILIVFRDQIFKKEDSPSDS
eukprot:g28461.t1